MAAQNYIIDNAKFTGFPENPNLDNMAECPMSITLNGTEDYAGVYTRSGEVYHHARLKYIYKLTLSGHWAVVQCSSKLKCEEVARVKSVPHQKCPP